jgi:predicted RNase H-like HicB family nuclease
MSEYVVIYEQGDSSWGAYCPDLPGLGVVGATRERVEQLIREGVSVHVASLREHGEAIPEPSSTAGVIALA